MRIRRLLPALLLSVAYAPRATAQQPAAAGLPGLSACEVGPFRARCGTVEVFENRSVRGRKIALRVVVLPASGPSPTSDPVVYVAGGPGSAATEAASWIGRELAPLTRDRDLVFVDQRGTGGSNRLACDLFGERDSLQGWLGSMLPVDAVRRCRAELEGRTDLAAYTTADHVQDLEEVRVALGYERLNLYGTSYGTRVAQEYLRRFPARVRSAVLQGVVPPQATMPTLFGRDADRALAGVVEDCERTPACHAQFPRLKDEARLLRRVLPPGPVRVEILHPRTGEPTTVTLSRQVLGEGIRRLLYAPVRAALVPAVVHAAARGDFAPAAQEALAGRLLFGASPAGLFLSVTCAEDLPYVPRTRSLLAEEDGTLLTAARLAQQTEACSAWPRAAIPPDFHEPVATDVPVLLLSGEWDPVTPPRQGEEAKQRMTRALHLVVPDGGHSPEGLQGAACVPHLIASFIQAGAIEGWDRSCLQGIRRNRFAPPLRSARPVAMDAAALERLAGRYAGDAEARVTASAGTLSLAFDDGPTFVLVPIVPTRFQVVGMLGREAEVTEAGGKVTLSVLQGGEVVTRLTREGT